MKKLSFIVSFLLLTAVFIAPLSVSAAENAGIKPGSFFYGFVTTFEKVNLFFTFNPEKKAEKAMKYAEKRLAEAEAVAGDKNSNAVKTAISGYEKSIALAAEASKKVKDETKAENLLNLIVNNTSKHQAVLTDVLSKVPDEAKEAITKAIETSKKGQEEAMKQVAELKSEVEKLKKEVEELKKQQVTSSTTSSQNTGSQSQSRSIKELKQEIEGLKKQAAEKEEREKQTANPVLPTTATPAPQTEIKAESQAVTLTNSLGISYTFEDPIINKQRIRELIDSGFVVIKGKLPEGIQIKSTESIIPTPTAQTQTTTATQTSSTIVSTPVPISEVRKELRITVIGGSCNNRNICEIEVQYFENTLESVNRKAASITVSSDDNGKFSTCDCNALGESSSPNLEGNPLTGNTYKSGSDGKPSAFFWYFPSAERAETFVFCSDTNDPTCTGLRITRTFTAAVNGFTKTLVLNTRYYPPSTSQ